MVIVAAYLVFAMLAVLWFDTSRYIIPNWLVFSLLLLYPLAVYLSHVPVDWKMALAGMLLVFAVGYVAFARRWMGGGDIKLITACSLWVGWAHLLDFIFAFALLGGVLAGLLWPLRKLLIHLPLKIKTFPRILREGEPVPYGIAIVLGFLLLMEQGYLFVTR